MYKKTRPGFLIAEYMLVMGLSFIVIGFSFSLARVFKGVVIATEVEVLKTVIQAQQAIALVSGKEQKIVLNPQQQTYTYDGVVHKLAQSVEFIFPEGALGPPSNPTTPVSLPISFAENSIVCFPVGSISSGVVYVGCPELNKFYALSSGISEWGLLRLYTMNNNKWYKV